MTGRSVIRTPCSRNTTGRPSIRSRTQAFTRRATDGSNGNDGGDTYVKQWLPPSVTDMSYPADRLVAEMDYANVDMALLHRTPYLGVGNEFLAGLRKAVPRPAACAGSHAGMAGPGRPQVCRLIRSSPRSTNRACPGSSSLPPQMDLYNDDGAWDRDEFLPFWDALVDAGILIFFSLKSRRDPLVENFRAEHDTLRRWLKRYASDARVVLTHGLFWGGFAQPDSLQVPDDLWTTFDGNDMGFQIMFPIGLGGIYDYPIPQSHAVLEHRRRKESASNA